jgi:hypothetical protein
MVKHFFIAHTSWLLFWGLITSNNPESSKLDLETFYYDIVTSPVFNYLILTTRFLMQM